jgi:ribosome-binding factor A
MSRRTERVNSLLRQEVSDLIQNHAKDPRLSCLVSVTQVETAPDMKYAKVYVSCICDAARKKEIMDALASAAGFFRTELVHRLSMRHVPDLDFRWDDSIEKGAHILSLIDRISGDKKPELP